MAILAAPICTVCHYQAFYHLGYFFIGFCNSQHSIPAPNYKCPTKSQNVGKINNNQEGEKAVHGGDRKSTDAKSSSLNANLIDSSKTCDRIAEENGVSRASVLRASHYTRGIDITDNRSPGIKQKVLRFAMQRPALDLNEPEACWNSEEGQRSLVGAEAPPSC